ncbi:DUF6478 family protein [Roseicyclus persicicus]|uniref:Uncharacterized protein n=1 Tax=Roseicyclus persicicus TaxID=2650661 RepID=A0A7X6GYX1_9RHOB|nr:DUF6478 family protein [Roseibacterium persicicum]NKX44945.1 hypothetical protein [Roseibacterium persicicum]
MGKDRAGFLGLFGPDQMLKRWERALQTRAGLAPRDLAGLRREMLGVRSRIDRLSAEAETELLARSAGQDGIARPDQCDWAERGGPWRARLTPRGHVGFGSPLAIGAGVTLFHDATRSDLSLRQEPARRDATGPVFALVLEVYRFDGSFLSLVQDLPDAALQGLTLDHFFQVHLTMDREQPIEVYARLNIQHGPNHEQIVRQFAFDGDRGLAEFDLAYSRINEKRVEKGWLDLILEGPEMNRVAIRDMVVLRAPRADI